MYSAAGVAGIGKTMHSFRSRGPWRSGGSVARSVNRVGFALHGTVTLVIILLCVGAFLAVGLLDLAGVVSRYAAIDTLGLSYVGIFQRSWLFQFLTAPFLHASVTHLAFNMLTLAFLGPSVERRLGRCRYIAFSALCASVASMSQLVWQWGSAMVGAGYSGVIFGLLAAQALMFPHARIYIYAFFPVKMKHAALILGAVELYLTTSGGAEGVGHVAHLGGALAAFVYLKAVPWRRAPSIYPPPRVTTPHFRFRRSQRTGIPWRL